MSWERALMRISTLKGIKTWENKKLEVVERACKKCMYV